MKREEVKRKIEFLDHYLSSTYQDYGEREHEAMMMAIKALEQEQKSEWEHDHEILKAYSNGANEVLDKIRAEIEAIIGERNLDDYDFCSGLICTRKIIDKYKAESEVEHEHMRS